MKGLEAKNLQNAFFCELSGPILALPPCRAATPEQANTLIDFQKEINLSKFR
jgi:hypothetical protein